MADRPHVVVAGGGITGLTAAWTLTQLAPHLAVTVMEAGRRPGGKIRTDDWEGVSLEAGPDTFLARQPWAVELCRELGLGDDLVAPATGQASVWTRGTLRRLPAGLVLGVPTRLGPVLRSGIISPPGVARAACDLVLPRSPPAEDPSVRQAIGGRLGGEVVDRLVEPLIGGINAGRADRLSLAATAPDIAAALDGGSIMRALRRRQRPSASPPGTPLFLGLKGGLQSLVDRLVDRVGGTATVLCDTSVSAVSPATEDAHASVRVVHTTSAGTKAQIDADAVILTVPASAAAAMVECSSPDASGQLGVISYASVTLTTLGYRAGSVPPDLVGSGFLVPPVDGRLMTACTFLTNKWPHLAGYADADRLVLFRCSSGRAGDDRPEHLDDVELAARLHTELTEAIGTTEAPVAATVTRWPRSFPQYDVGHKARVAQARAALARDLPAVVLAGAAYHGLGIAACVRQAREAAALVASRHER